MSVDLSGGADSRVPGVPAPLSGPRPRRAGAWRRCGAGREGAPGTSEQRSTIRLTSLVPRRLPLRFRNTASGGVSSPNEHGSSARRARLASESAQRSCMGTMRCLFPLPKTVTVESAKVQVTDVEAAELGHSQATAVEKFEHGMVP